MTLTLADLDKYRYKFSVLSQEEERFRLHTGLSRAQWEIYRHPARFRVVCAGRRFGKTFTLISELVRAAQTGKNRNVIYCAPTLKMSRTIFWKKLIQAVPHNMIASKNETLMEITIKGWNSTIRCYGADNPDSLRGNGYHFAAIDEAGDVQESLWREVLRPALSDTLGEAIIVGTPKGRNGFFWDAWTRAQEDESGEWMGFSFTSLDGGNIPDKEILDALKDMTWPQFSQEYLATFNNSIGRVYSNFDRDGHVIKDIKYNGGVVLAGIDFNVAPMSCVLAQETADGELHIFDEIELWGGHTQMLAQELLERFPGKEVRCFPDPSGRQRKTSAGGNTDFSILAKAGFKIYAPPRTVAVRDRINVLQAMLCDGNGRKRVKISTKCKSLINCLDSLSYLDNGKQDKSSNSDHMPDALSFISWYLGKPKPVLGNAKLRGG